MPEQDPYASIAKPLNDDPYASIAKGTGQGESPNYGTDVTTVNPTIGQIGKGVLREGAQLLSGAHGLGSSAINLIPGVKDSGFGQAMGSHQSTLENAAKPRNMGEAMGKTGAEMASYLIPAKAETAATELAPKAIRPIARIAAGSLSNGLMNQMNGGDFTTGAATGAGFGALSEGARAILAPALMRSAIPGNIGKDSANALLSETRGVRPSTVLRNTESRIGQAGSDLDAAIAAANQRATPHIRGFLMPPKQEIPLAPSPKPMNPRMRPMSFDAQVNPEEPMVPRSGNPMADISEYPGINPHYLSGSEHPELSGRVTPLQNPQQVTTRMGVLLRRPEMSASVPPPQEPNRMISLNPAKQPVGEALGTASRQRAIGDVDQIQPLMDFLRGEGKYGPARPDFLTPQEALDARRGYGKEFVSNRQWKQTTNSAPLAAAKQGYGGITGELHAKVPGSIEADDLMHNLQPAKAGLRTLVRNDPSIVGNVAGRVGARTGALTAAAVAGAEGAKRGLGGALLGGGLGLVAPEVLSSPAAKMAMARAAYSTATPKIGRALVTPAIQSLMDSIRQKRTGGLR